MITNKWLFEQQTHLEMSGCRDLNQFMVTHFSIDWDSKSNSSYGLYQELYSLLDATMEHIEINEGGYIRHEWRDR